MLRHRRLYEVKTVEGVDNSAVSEAEPTFEQIVERLSEVVDRLEGGELPLEESLAVFEEGIRLSRLGSARLDRAERRVEELLSDGTSRPIQTSADEDSARERT